MSRQLEEHSAAQRRAPRRGTPSSRRRKAISFPLLAVFFVGTILVSSTIAVYYVDFSGLSFQASSRQQRQQQLQQLNIDPLENTLEGLTSPSQSSIVGQGFSSSPAATTSVLGSSSTSPVTPSSSTGQVHLRIIQSVGYNHSSSYFQSPITVEIGVNNTV